jgi:hypothetical protein
MGDFCVSYFHSFPSERCWCQNPVYCEKLATVNISADPSYISNRTDTRPLFSSINMNKLSEQSRETVLALQSYTQQKGITDDFRVNIKSLIANSNDGLHMPPGIYMRRYHDDHPVTCCPMCVHSVLVTAGASCLREEDGSSFAANENYLIFWSTIHDEKHFTTKQYAQMENMLVLEHHPPAYGHPHMHAIVKNAVSPKGSKYADCVVYAQLRKVSRHIDHYRSIDGLSCLTPSTCDMLFAECSTKAKMCLVIYLLIFSSKFIMPFINRNLYGWADRLISMSPILRSVEISQMCKVELLILLCYHRFKTWPSFSLEVEPKG